MLRPRRPSGRGRLAPEAVTDDAGTPAAPPRTPPRRPRRSPLTRGGARWTHGGARTRGDRGPGRRHAAPRAGAAGVATPAEASAPADRAEPAASSPSPPPPEPIASSRPGPTRPRSARARCPTGAAPDAAPPPPGAGRPRPDRAGRAGLSPPATPPSGAASTRTARSTCAPPTASGLSARGRPVSRRPVSADYGRRYDDLATEVLLLEARLKAHTGNPAEIKNKAQGLADTLPTAAAVGDLEGLAERARAMVGTADSAPRSPAPRSGRPRRAGRAQGGPRRRGRADRGRVDGVEGLRRPPQGDRRGVEDDPRHRPQDRRGAVVRFAAARDAFGRRRGTHFAALDAQRGEARAAKQELITEAEKLPPPRSGARPAPQCGP